MPAASTSSAAFCLLRRLAGTPGGSLRSDVDIVLPFYTK
jgi:hypothetical protein